MICRNCKQPLKAGDKFCSRCGQPVSEKRFWTQSPDPLFKGKQRSWQINLIFLGGIGVAVLGILFAVWGYRRSHLFFPVNDESVNVTKAIQGTWFYSEGSVKTEDFLEYRISFNGTERFHRHMDVYITIARSEYNDPGDYKIDTVKDIIYLIPDGFTGSERVNRAEEVLYDYEEETGAIRLYYHGNELEK